MHPSALSEPVGAPLGLVRASRCTRGPCPSLSLHPRALSEPVGAPLGLVGPANAGLQRRGQGIHAPSGHAEGSTDVNLGYHMPDSTARVTAVTAILCADTAGERGFSPHAQAQKIIICPPPS